MSTRDLGRSGPLPVLYTAWAPFFSGAERALVILLESLDPERYRPIVALGTRGELEAELTARRIRTIHVPVVYAGLRTVRPWLQTVARLVSVCRREGVRLVHANDVPSFQPAGYAARWLGLPAVTHVRFPDTATGFGWFLRPGFNRAVFVSEALMREAVDVAPAVFGNRVVAIHDGVRLPDEAVDRDVREVRQELGLPTDRPVIAITGQVSEIKGIWDFVEASAQLVSRGVVACFAVLGDDLKGQGALRREVESAVEARGLAGHFRFLGFRRDAPRLLCAFDIVTVPSHVEPLGNATLEAMAAGRPVVGARVGGIPEMIVEGETGLLVPPKDGAALADALATLLAHPETARTFGRAGRHRVAGHFSPRRHAEAIEAQYAEVCRAGRRGAG